MSRRLRKCGNDVLWLFLPLFLLASSAARAQTTYTITDLGTLGGSIAAPTAINNAGQVVGSSSIDGGNTDFHAFLYSNGTMMDLGTPLTTCTGTGYGAVAYSEADGINDAGQIVGYSRCQDGTQFNAWVYNKVTATPIPRPSGCTLYPLAINASGHVTGYTFCNTGGSQPFLYDGTNRIDLGTPPANGRAINKFDQISGDAADGVGVGAFLYSNGVMSDLGTLPGGNYAVGTAINDSGQVAGFSSTFRGNVIHAFLYNGTMNDLGQFEGGDTYVAGMNSSGQMVGVSTLSNSYVFFLYEPGTGFVDLNTIVPSGSGITIRHPTAINDNGQIVGHTVANHAYLLAPGNTPTGTNIAVQPVDATTGTSPTSLTFSSVSAGGNTKLSIGSSGVGTPAGFKLGSPPTYYNLTTTAAYSGPITLCINYGGISFHNPSQLSIWHYDSTAAAWNQLSTTVNSSTTTACATTSSLSPFVLLEPVYQGYVQQPINSDGSSIFSVKKGVVPVKFMLTFGNLATCSLPSATIALTRTAGGTIGSIDESVYLMAADSGSNFRIDTTNCQYVYNLGSSFLGPGTYEVDILINSSFVGKAIFGLQ